jgi:signal transduction histidine kinase
MVELSDLATMSTPPAVVPSAVLTRRLTLSIRVSAAAGLCGMFGVGLVYATVLQAVSLLVILGATAMHQIGLAASLLLCRRSALARAAILFCVNDWIMVLVALVIVPEAAPALVPIVLARVVSTLPYVELTALRRLVAAALALGVVIGALSRVDLVGLDEQIPWWVVTVSVVFFVPVGVGIVGLDLLQHSGTLREIAQGALLTAEALRLSELALARQAEQLRRSRARLVATADSERRRVERDLHDGAQQTLVGLCLGLSHLAGRQPAGSGLREELLRLENTAQSAVTELRDLAHGIYPPILASHGLTPAIEAVLRRASVPVRARLEPIGRRPPEQEAAVYFCCREALQNAEKHAGRGVEVEVVLQSRPSGALQFWVADSGRGLPSENVEGQGMVNMRDRIAAVGGTLSVSSTPGGGTRISGTLPAATSQPPVPRSRIGVGPS